MAVEAKKGYTAKASHVMISPTKLRRVGFKDAETGIQYYFLTNNFELAARTTADIYKARRQTAIF